MSPSRSQGLGAIVLLVASLVGLAIALYAYFAPLTGVTGTLGALIVILVNIALAVGALVLAAVNNRGVRILLRILILLALGGNFFASLLLHQWWICIAMVVGLVGLILDMTRSNSANRPAHS
ncbi:hypothetical protein [Kushneria phosphatilytica]|uniref:Uncharacterized protein n=1 Tax=Kushneria phosphatilytica TaxID=657387 RepID=A0A1S1NTP0_9GAMM|nr:hypothetical protein [Kushneria phosphatilytica]OHV08840.1 hypothetical protein BH688_12575 [Kushneria phosphatilytica]QEL12560.1 hypothetical protein FY550_16375 [Kushneria phosphatilytica]